ncbi:MAG TPA: RNA-binding protein [Deltaproteobacteria bacterium]|nr:RNA-binding protein [Deltaproteobacteria bacterium]
MGKKLYVGNLPFTATEDSLKEEFSRFGAVESVNIITDRYTGQSKGFGFIEFSTKQDAAEAISKMNNAEMDGRTLKVSEALPQAPRDGGGARRSYGGGGGGSRGGGFRR